MSDPTTWFLADQAIKDKQDDQFWHDDVAEQLVEIITSIQAPATIGLIGGFGTGKSSITNLLAARLKSHRSYQLVSLSAEKHTEVARQRALVYSFAQALHEDAGVNEGEINKLLERVEHDVVREGPDLESLPFTRWLHDQPKGFLWRPIGWAALSVVVAYAVVVGVLALLNLPGWIDVNPLTAPIGAALPLFVSVAGVLGLAALIPDWLKAGFTPDRIQRSRPRIEAADEFERLFGTLADLCPKRLVVVVDDIDRLTPNEVLEALASVRTFQSIPKKNIVFILTCDEHVIREAVAHANPGLSAVDDSRVKAADEYLNKLFVVRQPLPPHQRADMRSYADALLARTTHAGPAALGDECGVVLDVLIHDRVESPRHVIRLLNAFFADYRLALTRENNGRLQPGEVTSRPTLLGRLTVLRTDYYDFFQKVVAEFALLDAADALLLGAAPDDEQLAILRDAFPVGIDETWSASAVPPDLADFLRRTVRHVDRERPLTAFIFLGQTEAGRVLGSERAEGIRRSLENGNGADLAARFHEGGEVARAAVSHAIDTVKHARPGIPLANAVGAAAIVLNFAPAEHRGELATELALVIESDNSTAPQPEQLASIIVFAPRSHREALFRILAEYPDGEEPAERRKRALAQLRLAGDDPDEGSVLITALHNYFASIPEETDSTSIPVWINAARAVPVASRNRALDSLFYAVLAALVVGASPGSSDEWRADFADLYSEAPAATDELVVSALESCLDAAGGEPRRVGLAVLARLALDAAHVARLLPHVASVITDEEPAARVEDVAAAVTLIGNWCAIHGDEVAGDGADATGIMAALAHAVVQSPDAVTTALPPVVGAYKVSAAEPIDALIAALDGRRHVGDELATAIRSALVDVADQTGADDAERINTGLLRSISVQPLEAPEVQFGLETLLHVLQHSEARGHLTSEIARWIELLNQVPTNPDELLTPLHALALVARGDLLTSEQMSAVLSRLVALRDAGQIRPALLGLAVIPWATDLRSGATGAIAPQLEQIGEEDKSEVVRLVSEWPPASPAEIDDGMQDALYRWLVSADRTLAQRRIAGRLWPGFTVSRRARLAAQLLSEVPALANAIATFGEAEMLESLIEASTVGTFEAVANGMSGMEFAGRAFGEFVEASFDATRAAWNGDAVSVAIAHADDATAAALVTTAMTHLAQGAEDAAKAAVVLSALDGRPHPARPAEDDLVRRIVDLLDTVQPDLAEHLGTASRWVPRRRFDERLKDLRGRKNDQRAREAAQRFEGAHSSGSG